MPSKTFYNRSWLPDRILLFLTLFLCWQAYIHWWALAFSSVGFAVLLLIKFAPSLVIFLRPTRDALSFALAWVVAEGVNQLGPWGHTGGTLTCLLAERPALVQSCSIFGPWLITFLLVLLVAGVLLRDTRALSVGLLSAFALWFWGVSTLQKPLISNGAPLSVSAVQEDLDAELKFRDPPFQKGAERLFQRTTLAAQSASLVIWPETAFPWTDLRWDWEWSRKLGMLAQETETTLLLGSLEENESGFENTVWLVGPDGRFQASYVKQRLIPFVEYLPWEELRSRKLFRRVSQIVSGTGSGLLNLPDESRVGVLICWESMNARDARTRTAAGADFLIAVSNDEWFEGTHVGRTHLRLGILRAVENRRSLAHVSNGGPSALIDPRGRILAVAQEGHTQLLFAELPGQEGLTFYTRYGDWFWVLACFILLALSTRERVNPLDERSRASSGFKAGSPLEK